MSMSIQERMARQAKLVRNSHQAPLPDSPRAKAISAAQRMSRQSSVVAMAKRPVGGLPPDEVSPARSLTAAERLRKQTETIAAAAHGGKTQVDQNYISALKADMQEYLKKLYANIQAMGIDTVATSQTDEVPDMPVNGISTPEGELVIAAEPSSSTGMPFQATPVITRKPRKPKGSRKAKTSDTVTETSTPDVPKTDEVLDEPSAS